MLDNIIIAEMDFINIVIFLVIVISSLIGQFIKGNAERKKRPRRPVKPMDVGDADPADQERGRLEDEIDAMLRRAIGADPKKPVEVDAIEPEVVQPHHVDPEIVVLREQRMAEPKPVTPTLVEPLVVASDSVADRHIQSDLAMRTDRFGSAIRKADQRTESRLQNTFDHKLGSLSEKLPSSDISDVSNEVGLEQATDVVIAERVVEMLTTPKDLPAAVVLSEVLRRPEW